MKHVIFFAQFLFITASLLGQERSDSTTQERVVIPENRPEFPGGQTKLFEFIANNIKYPAEARRSVIEGKVLVRFIVEIDGTINLKSIEIVQSAQQSLDTEVIRLIGLMPKWIPGNRNGRNVRAKAQFPVTFKLS